MSDLDELKALAKDNPEAVAEAEKLLSEREWPYVYELSAPVTVGKETVESLTFQSGTFGVLKGLNITPGSLPNMDQLMQIGARLCQRSLSVIERLHPHDAAEVIAIATGFFGRCHGAGRKP